MTGILNLLMGTVRSAVATDPYFEYTTLLLPGSGTNGAQNNTFLDASTNNFTITRNGNTTQGTFSPFSQTGWGNYFDGTGDYLSVPDNAAFTLGNSDFCIELWINSSPSMAGYAGFFGQWANATTNCSYVFRTQTSQIVQFSYTTTGNGQTGTVVNGSALTTNSWNHLVVCRSGANLAIFQNGTRTATHNISTLTISDSTRDMQIGYSTDGGHVLGYMSNLRLVKGSSVYDPTQTTITVPTEPLTAISGTSLLTCQSNRFIDNSTNNFTITRNGDTRVVAFSPFNPTASWSAATYGGSGYFDGSGDYLSVPDNAAFDFGTGDYTVELWIYRNNTTGDMAVLDGRSGSTGYLLYLNASNKLLWYVNAGIITGSTTIGSSQWYHIAISRVGTAVKLFVNGIEDGSATNSTSTDSTGLAIGAKNTASSIVDFNGYISNVRLLKGTGYSSITVPTAPLTAITNTSLLLNFTNAGIYDATSKNDLETVGNAQISTAITAKWGSGCMAFDGTGDYLTAQNNPLLNLGSSNFTIEAWIYPTTLNTYNYLYGRDGATNATSEIDFYIGSTGNIASYFYSGSTGYLVNSSGGAITTNSWQHVALVRNGVNYTIYVNGTSVATIATLSTLAANTVSLLPTIGNSSTTLTRPFTGYIQDFRFTRGYARYTSNFTAPTAAFPTL